MENLTKEEMKELKFKYKAALEVLKTKINVIYKNFEQNNSFNPIEHIKTRIKSDNSIYNKLLQDGYEITLENIENNIHDVAGIRIVCSFLSDIEKIEKIISSDKDIKIIKKKDYINNPKNTGYTSLHLNALIPVKMIDKTEYIETEIQIRTIAMDMWASLEHKLLYKSKYGLTEDIKSKMLEFAKETRKIDLIMEKLIILSNKYHNPEKSSPKDIDGLNEIENTSMLKYGLALKQVTSKIEEINCILTNQKDLNPIEHIKTRIKNPISITKKLEKRNYAVTEENMQKHIHDLVGIRIVCSFLSDLEEIKEIIKNDPDIDIIKETDYINNPKENGYRSYHLNIKVPVKILGTTEYVEAEIQLRTIAMDMWASLEHKISYKKNGNISEEIKTSLKEISNYTHIVDERIENFIESSKKTESNNKTRSLELIPQK